MNLKRYLTIARLLNNESFEFVVDTIKVIQNKYATSILL